MEPDSSLDLVIEDLPGIGRRYEMTGANGGRIIVIITHSGRRLVHGRNPGDDQASAVELSDQQARKLGAILGGAFFKPAIVRDYQAITVPEPSETLEAGDRLVIIGRRQDNGPFHKLVVD
jgi:TrkA domain protein